MKNHKRLCLYPKDVQLITGKSYKHSCRYLMKIRKHCQKEPHQFVTVVEFCAYTGLPEELVSDMIN